MIRLLSFVRGVLVIFLLLPVLGACNSEPQPQIPPRQLTSSPFQYPEELWDEGIKGETTLKLLVTEQGAVDSVRVERSSGHAAFDTAAVQGARLLRFEPARRGEDPVPVWVLLPVQFNMTNADEGLEPAEEGEGAP